MSESESDGGRAAVVDICGANRRDAINIVYATAPVRTDLYFLTSSSWARIWQGRQRRLPRGTPRFPAPRTFCAGTLDPLWKWGGEGEDRRVTQTEEAKLIPGKRLWEHKNVRFCVCRWRKNPSCHLPVAFDRLKCFTLCARPSLLILIIIEWRPRDVSWADGSACA